MANRPSFADDFPRTPEFDALVDDFVRGDYARIRIEAPRIEQSSADEAVRRAAHTLFERTEPAPLAVALLALVAILLTVLATCWIIGGKAPTPDPRPLPVHSSPLP